MCKWLCLDACQCCLIAFRVFWGFRDIPRQMGLLDNIAPTRWEGNGNTE